MLKSEAETYVDLQVLEKSFAGKESVLRSLINEYASQVKTLLPHMRSALQDEAFGRLEDSAHTLKGNSALIGAFKMQDAAKRMESACKEHDTASLASCLDELDAIAEKTLFYLDAFVNE